MARVRVRRAVSLLAGLLVAGYSPGLHQVSRDMHQARERISTGSHIVQTPAARLSMHSLVMARRYWSCMARGGYDQGLELASHSATAVSVSSRCLASAIFAPRCQPTPQRPHRPTRMPVCSTRSRFDVRRVVGVSAWCPPSMQFALRHPAGVVRWCPGARRLCPATCGARAMQTPPGRPSCSIPPSRLTSLLGATRLARSTVIRAILATPRRAWWRPRVPTTGPRWQGAAAILPVSPRRRACATTRQGTSSLQRYELRADHQSYAGHQHGR